MERMWSYLRRFTRMTKEMRPSHRIDVLSHALLYYGSMTKKKLRELEFPISLRVMLLLLHLASLLVDRWKRADRMNTIARQTFLSLTDSLPTGNMNTFACWKNMIMCVTCLNVTL